jgi:hypothetical protein
MGKAANTDTGAAEAFINFELPGERAEALFIAMAALVPTAGELHQHTSVCRCHLRAQISSKGHAMKIPRRRFLHLAVGTVAVSAMPRIQSVRGSG